MVSTYTLDDLKNYHHEAISFFGSELMLLKEVIPKIKNERIAKAGVLLISCGQTGAALLQLASQTDSFTTQAGMLARAFMETITNFCYVGVCDEHEYRAFILHPIYKQYHNIDSYRIADDLDLYIQNISARKDKQSKFKEIPIVKEALEVFSETKPNLNWTKKTLYQRIGVLKEWGKFMDAFFTINKIQYYSDASEALHGSLYGCTYQVGTFDPEFDFSKKDELEKKLYKESSCILLHLGMLIHESFTLISYSDDIKDIWDYSYKNRGQALNLLFRVLEKKDSKTTFQ
ncbi:DUF5677 domain-containing protein [Pedobacter sp. BG31]|uniref:DUF5677 domain-containing protein n=1 Tax=Pedobacter sp. BG31 TaxID=3349697 RepID=UPI0035F2D73C